jgi:hypothetical protein
MTQTELLPINDIKHLACQSTITAHIDGKGLFGGLSNLRLLISDKIERIAPCGSNWTSSVLLILCSSRLNFDNVGGDDVAAMENV